MGIDQRHRNGRAAVRTASTSQIFDVLWGGGEEMIQRIRATEHPTWGVDEPPALGGRVRSAGPRRVHAIASGLVLVTRLSVLRPVRAACGFDVAELERRVVRTTRRKSCTVRSAVLRLPTIV